MSSKEFGCFFCNGKSEDPAAECPECGRPLDVGSEFLGQEAKEYRIQEILGRGFYGWTFKAWDHYQPFALKLVPNHRVVNLSAQEAQALVACAPHRNIARFTRAFNEDFRMLGLTVEVQVLVFEFIEDAATFRNFLDAPQSNLKRADVTAIIAGIASGLGRMHARGLWHRDAHDQNILIRSVRPDENLPERFEPKLIDFGSSRQYDQSSQEESGRGDYEYLAKHIYGLVGKFERERLGSLSPVDRSFAQSMRQVAHRLSDRHVSRRNLTPAEVALQVEDILESCSTGVRFPNFEEMRRDAKVSITEPLENSNALALAPQDVLLLFRDSLKWEAQLKKSESVVVVGPRGCGKTMLLRWFSMQTQARPLKSERKPEQVRDRLCSLPRIAFLVSCGELRTPFLRSAYKDLQASHEDLAEEYCREFVNAHFALEVARVFEWLRREKLGDLTDEDCSSVALSIRRLLPEEVRRRGVTGMLPVVVEVLERRIAELSNLSGPPYEPSDLARDDVLETLCRAVAETQLAKGKEVWFMMDDYSTTVLPAFAQMAYNPVLFRPSESTRVKVSSEGTGPVLGDHLGRRYKEGRELTRVNLGEIYFRASEPECRRFFEEILRARFSEVGKGSLETLRAMLGEHPDEMRFGRYIVSQSRPGDARFHGFGLLCRLCSGDVSFILELLHSITKGKWDQGLQRIEPKEQDDVVKEFAQRQLASLRQIADDGPLIHEFANRVGGVLKEYLLQSAPDGKDERLRIEVEGSGELNAKADEIHTALLRHTVLVEGGSGKSREGLPTRKLYFRRLFSPCFPFSPSRKGCITLTKERYEEWLQDPTSIRVPERKGGSLPLFEKGD